VLLESATLKQVPQEIFSGKYGRNLTNLGRSNNSANTFANLAKIWTNFGES